jgi:hypothetical protein
MGRAIGQPCGSGIALSSSLLDLLLQMHVLRVSQTVRVWESHREQRSKRVHKSCTNLLWVLAQEAFASPPSCCCCNQMRLLNRRKKHKTPCLPGTHLLIMPSWLLDCFPFLPAPQNCHLLQYTRMLLKKKKLFSLGTNCVYSLTHLRSVNAPSIREHATRVLDCNQKPENVLLERCIGKTCT